MGVDKILFLLEVYGCGGYVQIWVEVDGYLRMSRDVCGCV